ncbi:MAG: hypothetical protein ACHQIM_01120 [Sphingobacteriales bacterium]
MLKIYKPAVFALMALLALNAACFAQDTASMRPSEKPKHFNEKAFRQKMDNMDINLNMDITSMVNDIVVKVTDIVPKINLQLNDFTKDLNLNIEPQISLALKDLGKSFDYNYANKDEDNEDESGAAIEKYKSYTKSYPLDAGDKIKLSNQYGRITVTTWDRHEIKVDVQVKAQAADDEDAQKLLNGVQIKDSKEGGLVSFRTSIEPGSNSSWKIWNWGNKKHKLEINYTVYMPAKNDLNVEDNYGAIELPGLDGKVRIRSSYGSVLAQNLNNPSDDIEGSYGSLKVASLNGAHLDYSYGSVDIEECNNLKADLSYGSFKLGKLKGNGDFDLSYVGGFKIDEMASSFKHLNVNASYSGVALGLPGNDSFDFDITATYGGFSYNDDKVTITSKTPADGSKHYSPTKNYKGHYGKAGSDAQITVHSTYGNVSFE